MNLRTDLRAALLVVLASALAATPAHALVTFNDSHDHIYVTGTLGISRDSNIFATRDSVGDTLYTTTVTADYTRRAGWIGVNASVAGTSTRFGKVKTENFSNPSYSMELTKQSGRTTGSVTLSAARESRADSAINLRATSWNYQAGLNFKYPVIERFTVSGSFGYSSRNYVEKTQLVDLNTYTASTDLFYVFTNERDLVAGYRFRHGETSSNTSTTDHSVTAGVTGRIIRGINGSLRVGYQVRTPHGSTGDDARYRGLTANGAATYAINKKVSINGQVGKDYSTTATDISVDSTTAGLSTSYAFNRHWTLSGGAGWGDSRFLGDKGRVELDKGPPRILGRHRHDNYASWNVGLAYVMNEHFTASLTYAWFENWSTLSFADFVRNNWGLTFSSRW
jgi:long-subunit fatty acid transport protein